jgi:hypothetical protein
MCSVQRRLIVLVLAGVLVPMMCLADASTPSDENRELLAKWKQDPEHMARLKRNQAAFRRLSPEAQDRLRKLDHDLTEETPGIRRRLEDVQRRYSAWLGSLSEDQRRSIESAPDRRARLERIRNIRMGEWLRRLPKAQREQLAKLKDGKERNEFIHKLWQEDLDQRADWQAAERNWEQWMRGQGPQKIQNLSKDMQQYVEKNLNPVLTADEKRRLEEAEGKWPRFPRVLIELIDAHPTSIMPVGPTRINDLKDSGKVGFLSAKQREHLSKFEGKWPEFGIAVRDTHKKGEKRHIDLDPRYTPANPKDFPLAVRQFIETRLQPALSEDEQRTLSRQENIWPAYPKLVIELARKHNLPIPVDPIPNAAEWDRYRVRPLLGDGR